MRFKGKVPRWLYALPIGAAILLIPVIVCVAADANIVALVFTLLLFAAIELGCLPIACRNFVELREEELWIVFGFVQRRIPYHRITALVTTDNPLPSLAASLDRVEIRCGDGPHTRIAVVDQEGFFTEMRNHNPDVVVVI